MRNTKRTVRLPRHAALTTGFLISSALALQAAPFTYSSGDLVLAFRQQGQSDLVVDIGQAAAYDALSVGTTVTVTNLSSSLLTGDFPSLNSLNWSVSGAVRVPGGTYPLQTIWASEARTNNNVQSAAWLRQGSFAQGGPASEIAAVGNNAATYSSANPSGPDNTTNELIIPSTDPDAYTPLVSAAGGPTPTVSDFQGTFQGNVENITPFDFTSAESLSRLDLYELIPGTTSGGTVGAPGKLVGTFNFTPNGTVTFTAGAQLARPTITGIQRNGNTTTVSFASISSLTYSLYFTNSAGLSSPISSWPTNGVTVVGNGSVLTLQDTGTDGIRFYALGVHP